MEISINDLLKILKKNWYILIILAAVAAAAGYYATTVLMHKEYATSAMVLVSSTASGYNSSANGSNNGNQADTLTLSDYDLNTKLVNSYRILCKSNRVLTQVAQQLGNNISPKALAGMINVSAQENTDIINITVISTSPQFAQSVANTLVDVFEKEVTNIMKLDNVQVIDYAQVPNYPISPNVERNTMMAGLVGLLIGGAIAFLRFIMDDTLKESDAVTDILETPVIGIIPKLN